MPLSFDNYQYYAFFHPLLNCYYFTVFFQVRQNLYKTYTAQNFGVQIWQVETSILTHAFIMI